MRKSYEVSKGKTVACLCIGFRPNEKDLSKFGLELTAERNVSSDCGGSHQVLVVFDDADESGKTLKLIDTKYESAEGLRALVSDDEWQSSFFIFRDEESFQEYYTDDVLPEEIFQVFVTNGSCLVKTAKCVGVSAEKVKEDFLKEYSAFLEPQYFVRVEPHQEFDEDDWLG